MSGTGWYGGEIFGELAKRRWLALRRNFAVIGLATPALGPHEHA